MADKRSTMSDESSENRPSDKTNYLARYATLARNVRAARAKVEATQVDRGVDMLINLSMTVLEKSTIEDRRIILGGPEIRAIVEAQGLTPDSDIKVAIGQCDGVLYRVNNSLAAIQAKPGYNNKTICITWPPNKRTSSDVPSLAHSWETIIENKRKRHDEIRAPRFEKYLSILDDMLTELAKHDMLTRHISISSRFGHQLYVMGLDGDFRPTGNSCLELDHFFRWAATEKGMPIAPDENDVWRTATKIILTP